MSTYLHGKIDSGFLPKRLDAVIRYHQETKHHFGRYARSLGYLDWTNQPDPFRRFAGAPFVPLPLAQKTEDGCSPSYEDLYRPGMVQVQPVDRHTISRFLELALGLSAWKQAGEVRWALRNNPSSGNLHPTEGYIILRSLSELTSVPVLYHYAPHDHGLERRCEFPEASVSVLFTPFPDQTFFIGLTSVHWREAWKYGERAFRYCQHDVGHAIGALRLAAATLGWHMALLKNISDDQLACLLGTSREEDFQNGEPEHPDCLAVVWPAYSDIPPSRGFHLAGSFSVYDDQLKELCNGVWQGRANRLSRDNPIPWEMIDMVVEASWRGETMMEGVPEFDRIRSARSQLVHPLTCGSNAYPDDPRADHVIRQRRSAVAFDGRTGIPVHRFYTMMCRLLPRMAEDPLPRGIPWDVLWWRPRVHLVLFIHRIPPLPPGLYCLVRDPKMVSVLKNAMKASFAWTVPTNAPDGLPLYLLEEGDARSLAVQVSCHQDIAGASAFSLGMLAEFQPSLQELGAWFYRQLFWETGLIGQVLYLEAEAMGVRATGIGCFFDDPVHQVFGIKNLDFQSLYHFTIGGAIDDDRLITLPPYAHLDRKGSKGIADV